MMLRCRDNGLQLVPLVREVVIASKGPLSPWSASSSITKTPALKHQLLNKRKQDTVAASYNAVGALNYFVGRTSSKINLLVAFNSSGVFQRRRASYAFSRTTRPPRSRVLHSERGMSQSKCRTRGTSDKAEDPL